MRVVAPHEHWHIFLGDKPAPSANWKEVVESYQPHDELIELVSSQGNMRGIAISRYGHDAFIGMNPDAVMFTLDNTILRYIGRSGQRPLVEVTDIDHSCLIVHWAFILSKANSYKSLSRQSNIL